MDILIDERVDAYLDRVATLHALCFDRPWTAEAIADLLARPGAAGAVCLGPADGGMELLGFVLVQVAGEEAEILTLAVEPRCRGRGIGKRLVAAARDLGRRAGARTLFLEVQDGNAAAIALYGATGFEQFARRRGYYRLPGGGTADALLMRSDLTARPT